MYDESEQQEQKRDRAFTYHAPRADQPPRYQQLRAEADQLAQLMNRYCPESRELSLAHTHLEQSIMWANAAIARNEQHPPA